jgi:hypothetical protein
LAKRDENRFRSLRYPLALEPKRYAKNSNAKANTPVAATRVAKPAGMNARAAIRVCNKYRGPEDVVKQGARTAAWASRAQMLV